MKDKICVVTGASSGIGYGVALSLSVMNAVPVLLSRDNQRGRETYKKLRRINGNVEWLPADLSSQRSVREFAEQFSLHYGKCDVLFNCAGVQKMQRDLSEDGLEMMFATNYLGHFLLTNLLFDALRTASESKVITTSGSSHKASAVEGRNVGRINLQDLQAETDFSFSNQSKQVVLSKILFTYELSRRWKNYDIAVCTLSPGLVKTNLVSRLPWYVRTYFDLRCALMRAQTPEGAARHYIDLAKREDINGKYFEADSGQLVETRSSDESYDKNIARKLWNASETLVGQCFDYR